MARLVKAKGLGKSSPEEDQFPPKAPLCSCGLCSLRECPFVPPYGNQDEPLLAIVGEAPGKDEVIKGRPFIGRSGSLLSRILTSLDLSERQVYLTNACMCKPLEVDGDIKNPSASDIDCCRERLFAELTYINPKVIVAAGGIAVHSLFGEKKAITKARGKSASIRIGDRDIVVMPTLHPAGVLRSPAGFPDMVFDIERAIQIANGAPPWIEPPVDKYVYITKKETKKFEVLLERLYDVHEMAVDLETTGLHHLTDDIVTCALSWAPETAVSFEWALLKKNPQYLARFGDHLHRIACSFQNGMFDTAFLHKYKIWPNYRYDTMLMDYTLDERQGIHDLERMAVSRYWAPTYKKDIAKNIPTTPMPIVLEYNATDADYTYRLTKDLRADMKEDYQVHDDILIPAAKHFTEFNELGMRVDSERLESLGYRWEKEMDELKMNMKDLLGRDDFNPNSPPQIKKILFKDLGLKMMGGQEKITRIDQMTLFNEIRDIEDAEAQDYWRSQSSKNTKNIKSDSTSMYMLYWLAQQHEFPRLMVKYRLVSKKHGTYYKGIKEALWSDGRLRPQYKLHGTVTGRLSTEKPNIHGTPRVDKVDKIKDNYISDDGFLIIYGDYSQAEVRMAAHFSKDRRLIEILAESDIHYAIMKKLFGLTDQQAREMPPEKLEFMRRSAKTITFGILYGRSPKGLAPQMGIPVEEASLYLDQYFDMMPDMRRWIIKQKERVLIDHEVRSLYGRRRRFPFIADRGHSAEIQRQAVNMPIQSSVSDMTLLANIRTIAAYREAGIICKPYPHIHDAFMIQAEANRAIEAAGIMGEIMKDVGFDTDVPFFADIKIGDRWGSVHKIEGGK